VSMEFLYRQRYDFDGNLLHEKIHVTKCGSCGMGLVSAREYHPFEACEEFERTHDSRKVWRMLRPMLALHLEEKKAHA
jgi:uncharacterized OB-fold protein